MKKKIIAFIFILLFAFIVIEPKKLNAESFLSDKSETRYDVTSGLLTGKANTICQTDDGYIWIGQYAGLTKFDNKSFTTFTNLQGHNLTSIVTLANKGNTLFIGSEKGLFIKDEKNNVEKVETTDVSLVVKDIKIWGNYALIGTTNGIFRYDIQEKTIVRDNTMSISRIAVLDETAYYYIVGKNLVYCNKLVNPVVEGSFKSIFCDDDKVYLGTRTGYVMAGDINLDYTLSNITNYQPVGLNGTVNDLLVKDDNIYICGDEGCFFGNKNDINNIDMVKSYIDDYNSMEKAFFDYEGNLWLASSSSGVYKISSSKIIDYFFEHNIDNAITYAIERFHGYFFIGTSQGIYVVSDSGKKIEIPDDGYSEDIEAPQEEKELMKLINIIGTKAVRDIEVYDNNIYFATYGSNGLLYYFSFDNIGTSNSTTSALLYDDLSLGQYESQSDAAKDFRSLKSNDEYLFVGLDKGVARYDGENYKYLETNVYPLYMTINGDDLYVVLNTIGVGKVSISSFANYKRIDEINSYSTLKCMYTNGGILFSDNNELYFYKDNNIRKIDINIVGSVVDLFIIDDKYYICSEAIVYVTDNLFDEKPHCEIIDSNVGLKSSLVANSSGYYDEETNKYYFASSSGVLVYDLDNDINSSDHILRKISIDTIFVDGRMIQDQSRNIHLKRNDNNLVINFSVLSFRKEQNYNVYYKLSGYDKEYQRMAAADTFQINYKNLEGGKYSFELYTEDFDGTRSYNVITFNISKTKTITEYEAFWVGIAMLAIAVVSAAIVIFYKRRIRKTIERQLEYKAITLESIEAIARTIDAKDKYTNGHSKRVGIYSREIARAMEMSNDEIDNIYYIALLHDIGKISIPLEILNKPGKLTDEEFEIMKNHTTAGGKILEGISTIPHIVEGAMYHHERYDGGGYPNHLKGEDIPLIARIICCADCYDAMATRRTYKEPYTQEKIISEFERCKGTQFDPIIADIVIRLIKEDRLRYGTELRK